MAASGHRRISRLFVAYWWQLMLALGIPLAAAIAVEAYYGYRAQLDQVKRTQSVQSLALALAIESNLQRDVRYVTRLYQVPWPGDRLRHLAEEIEVATSLFPSILQVSIVQGGNERLFVSQLEPRRIAQDVRDSSALATPAKPVEFSAAHIGPRAIPAIVARIPSTRHAGETLEMAIDLRATSDLLAQAGKRDASIVYLVGNDGKILAHSDPALAHGAADVAGLDHVRQARADRSAARTGVSVESADAAGRTVMATIREMPTTGWLIVMERPLAEAMAPIKAEGWRALMFLAIALFAATALGAALAHRFTRPVLQLGVDVEKIGRGVLSHRTAVRTGDEVQRLGEQINEMARRLEEYTTSLEKKVDEKTAHLQGALKVAEDAVRTRAMFLAAASHDLRQPLYAISLFADAMSVEPLPEAVADTLHRQRRAIASLRTLFDNLLDLSRFDAGEIRACLARSRCATAFRRSPRNSRWSARRRGSIGVGTCRSAASSPIPSCCARLVQNLLSNAVQYTPARLGVARSESDRRARAHHHCGHRHRDRPEDQARIFEEFVQLGNPARDREKGVGLGLSIVNRISALIGAHVSLTSRAGAGTSVSFDIPLARMEWSSDVADVDLLDSEDVAGIHAWAVEDDPAVRMALSKLFDAWRMRHSIVGSRAELETLLARGELPDIVLLDDMLGSAEGGLEIASWLAAHLPAERIVLITGNVNESRIRSLEASGFVVLRKPLASSDLLQWIRDVTRTTMADPT
jgi:signal transduction histidine kinase/CheY-like chemotaxis protein